MGAKSKRDRKWLRPYSLSNIATIALRPCSTFSTLPFLAIYIMSKLVPDHVRIDVQDDASSTMGTISESTPLLPMNGDDTSVRTIRGLPDMQIRSHLIDSKANVKLIPSSKEALSGAKKKKGMYWIDIDADDRDSDELRDWLEQLQLPTFFLSQLAEPSRTWFSEVVSLKGCVLAVIRILPEKVESEEVAHLAALAVGKNLLLTFTSCPKRETGGLYHAALKYMHERERLPDASSSGALLAWLRFHLERTSRSTRELSGYVQAMDEAMDRNIHAVKLQEIIEVKDRLLRVLSVAEEQHECLEALVGVETDSESLDFKRLKGALSVLLSKTGASERAALRLEKHITELRSRHETHQQERINRRLAVLTVLSAIFLPLTLLTGIWGMNFAFMPELQAPEAYPIALAFMLFLAASMFYFFWRSGWFD
jgi:Mg2+ and Co2+ transporter CorA